MYFGCLIGVGRHKDSKGMAPMQNQNQLPAQFLTEVHELVVGAEERLYRDHLATAGTDPYWQSIHGLYESLTQSQRAVLLSMVRQVSIDVVASVLHILDNGAMVAGVQNFVLQADGTPLNGDLCELYLSKREEELAR